MSEQVDAEVSLSFRELAVIRGIVDGKTYRQIAEEIDVGFETVRTNVASVRNKLGIRSKAAIAAWAVRNNKV